MSLNKAMIIGNLGKDPELRYTQSGRAVANLSVATNEKWTDNDGNPQERTEWHRVVVWGRQAENCEKYLSKGRQVYVEGRIQTRDWTDNDGNKRYSTEIVAQTVQFLSGGGSAGSSAGGPPPYTDSDFDQSAGGGDSAESNFDQSFNDDDIPF